MKRFVNARIKRVIATNNEMFFKQIKEIADEAYKEGKLTSVLTSESIIRKEYEKKRLFVGVFDDHVIGFVHFRVRRDGVLRIYEIAIKKCFRYSGKGFGSLLITELLAKADVSRAMLLCSLRNHEGICFWLSLGFIPCRIIQRWNKRKQRYSYFVLFEKRKE